MAKDQTQARYFDGLNRVDDYIFAHLEDEISFDRLAEIACLSPYHWSRIYSAMRGETIVATVRRLRLQRAADRLANSAADIGEIAGRAGYGSTETFGRAFRAVFDMSPAAYREAGSHAAFTRANGAADADGFAVELVTLGERRCAGIDHIGSYMEIDHAMGRLFSELAVRQALPAAPEMIGVFFDDPDLGPEKELRSRACLPIGEGVAIDPPAGFMCGCTIPALMPICVGPIAGCWAPGCPVRGTNPMTRRSLKSISTIRASCRKASCVPTSICPSRLCRERAAGAA